MKTYVVFFGMTDVTLQADDPIQAADLALPLLQTKYEQDVAYDVTGLVFGKPAYVTQLRVREVK
jgi:hypothetical protein